MTLTLGIGPGLAPSFEPVLSAVVLYDIAWVDVIAAALAAEASS